MLLRIYIGKMRNNEENTISRMNDIILEIEKDLNLVRNNCDKLTIKNEQLITARDQSGKITPIFYRPEMEETIFYKYTLYNYRRYFY